MTVIKSKRKFTPLQAITETQKLVMYTIQLCTNEQRFPKRYRWCLTQKIVDAAISVKANAAKANSVYVHDGDCYKLRRSYQQRALAELSALEVLMDTAYNLFAGLRQSKPATTKEEPKHQKGINISAWSCQLITVRKILLAWKKADADRYKDLLR